MNKTFTSIAKFLLVAASLTACSSDTSTAGGSKAPTGSPSASPAALAIDAAIPNTSAGLEAGDPVAIEGRGFGASTKIFVGETEVAPLDVEEGRVRFAYAPDLDGLHPGPVSLSVQNGSGPKVTADGAFFHFPSAWRILPNFLDGRVTDLALPPSSEPLLATDQGVFFLQGRFQRGAVDGVPICGVDAPASGCPAGFENQCLTLAPPVCFTVKRIESSEAAGASFALAEREDTGERKVLTSTDGHAWTALPPFDANPLAIKATPTALYVLTANSLNAGGPGHWDSSIPLSDAMKANILAETRPPFGAYSLEVLEQTDEVDFAVGTPKGLFQSAYVPGGQGAPTWFFSGPSANCGNVNGVPTICGPKITALAVDAVQKLLYFSYVPHETWPSGDNGRIEKVQVGFINADLAASIPWVYGLAFLDGHLMAVGWSPSAKDKDSVIYKVSPWGSITHVYSRFQTLGFPTLPTGAGDEVTMIDEEEGSFYAYLRARRCLLSSPTVPAAGSTLECLGSPDHFHQGAAYLFFRDGSLFAETAQGTYVFHPSTSIWEASSVFASESFRQDADLAVVSHEDGLPEPPRCALSLPDQNLVFACTSKGVYASFDNGPWTQTASDPSIHSLAYDPASHLIYGASPAQGVFRFTLP